MRTMKIGMAAALLLAAMLAVSGARAVRGAAPVTVQIDADPATAGVQTSASLGMLASFPVAVVLGNVADVEAFNFEVTYDQTVLSSPTIVSGSTLDQNPDANQAALAATGRLWFCSPPAPVGDNDPSPTVGAAFLSCFSTGFTAGPTFAAAGSVVATIQFTALTVGSSSLGLRNVNVFKAGGFETGSCAPVTVVAASCTGATVSFAPRDHKTDANADGYSAADESTAANCGVASCATINNFGTAETRTCKDAGRQCGTPNPPTDESGPARIAPPTATGYGCSITLYTTPPLTTKKLAQSDVDLDGMVSILDLAKVASWFGNALNANLADPRWEGDMDGDGHITILDLASMASNFSRSVANNCKIE